jgi:hypothetical protein
LSKRSFKRTEVQKGNTANQSVDANDLSVMVQDVLGTTEAVVLPTTEQATNMVTSGWQANKVFDAVDRETLLVVLVSKIATQVVVVKAKLSIEKVTNSSG